MKLKRVLAYLIDLLIVTVISSFVYGLFFSSSINNDEYNNLSLELVQFISNDTSGSSDIDEDYLIDLMYRSQLVIKPLLFIKVGMLIMYFGIIAYLAKGKTLGKKLLKLQVVPNDGEYLNPGLFILRSIIVSNFVPQLIGLITLIFCSKSTWFEINSILNYVSYFIYFFLLGFIIFRDDERGLHDLITNTKVIEITKQKE